MMLIGYYEIKQLTPGPAQTVYQQQVFWLIQNHPESVLFSLGQIHMLKVSNAAAFEEGKKLWIEQVARKPKNAKILGNAAAYCLLSDDATTEKLLRQAEALEPNSSIWPDKLGELYRLEGKGPHPSAEIVQQSAKKALAEYELSAALAIKSQEAAFPLADKSPQPSTSPDLAKTAFDAGEYDEAKQYASDLLRRGQSQQSYGHDPNDDVHAANLVLGLLALHDGDQAGAEAHLLAMGRVSGSPVLDSFGPNMQLAKDLLERGDRQPVLAYFDECAKFWKDKQLNVWRSQVKQGRIPDFRGNLGY